MQPRCGIALIGEFVGSREYKKAGDFAVVAL